MILPSKELLSVVLNNKLELGDIDRYYLIKDERHLLRLILTDKTDCWNYDINIYELANKCKEWAIKIDYKIESHIHFINKRIIGVASFNTQDNTNKFFQTDTEPEAIFKACDYIMEQTKCGS